MAEEVPEKLGRYEIVRELGKGAMGIVYEGRDPNIGRRVAIKTARRDVLEASGRADEMMERFKREAASAGNLNHPNIITIYDAGEEDGMAFIAMEFLEGGDLEEHLAKNKFMDQEEAVEICATICSALHFAHRDGVVHRDIKPANIIMTEKGIKLADFGIAHMSDSNLTQEGAMIGTPHYMSPEQFQGRKVDGRSDLFSVGVMLYEMLTGEKPFTGEQLSTVMTAVIKMDPIEPSELNSMVDDTLSRVVMKALSKNPGKRYADGDAFAAALRESIKPNPDPAITQVVAAAGADLGATVAGPAHDSTTVVGEAPALQGGGTTVSRSSPGPAASPTEADGAAATIMSTATPETVEPVVDVSGKKLPAAKIVVGIAVLAAVVLGIAVASGKIGGDGSGAAPENYWAPEATVEVRLIDTVEQYKAWDLSVSREFPPGAKAPTAAMVKIGPSNSRAFDESILSGAKQSFTIPEHLNTLEKWEFIATHPDGYRREEASLLRSPKKPGDILAIKIAIVKVGVAEKATLDFNVE